MKMYEALSAKRLGKIKWTAGAGRKQASQFKTVVRGHKSAANAASDRQHRRGGFLPGFGKRCVVNFRRPGLRAPSCLLRLWSYRPSRFVWPDRRKTPLAMTDNLVVRQSRGGVDRKRKLCLAQ